MFFFVFLFVFFFSFVNCLPNKAKGGHLEGPSHAGVKHYGTDLNKLMRGMVEVSRANGKRIFFKSEQTKMGSLETRVILPDTEEGIPQGLTQVGGTQMISDSGWQSEQQSLPQQVMPEEEMVLPDKQFVQ